MTTPKNSRKRRRRHARERKRGQPPGAPIYVGADRSSPVNLELMDYDHSRLDRATDVDVSQFASARESLSTSWLNVDGIHDAPKVAEIGSTFGIHALWIEDILNPFGRPKAEMLNDHVFVVAKMLATEGEVGAESIATEQVSMVVGPTWVVTFQERPGDVFDGVRKRISGGLGTIAKRGADYLLHALLDAIVDNYFIAVDVIESRIDTLEEGALTRSSQDTPHAVVELKKQLRVIREAVWPMRELVAVLVKGEGNVIVDDTVPFFRDLYDHVVQVMDIVDSSRERLTGVIDLNLSLSGDQMNKTMRVLTVVATLFIPLTFIAGLYGMNFKNMPELDYPYGYHVTVAVMIGITVVMLWWFKRRKWM